MPESYNGEVFKTESQVKVNMPSSKPNSEPNKVKRALKWVLTLLPLGGVIWASLLPLQTWMQQALVLVTLLWFIVFFLLDTFFLGG
jgi:polyferredoxin